MQVCQRGLLRPLLPLKSLIRLIGCSLLMTSLYVFVQRVQQLEEGIAERDKQLSQLKTEAVRASLVSTACTANVGCFSSRHVMQDEVNRENKQIKAILEDSDKEIAQLRIRLVSPNNIITLLCSLLQKGRGEFNKETTKVLHMQMNPELDAREKLRVCARASLDRCCLFSCGFHFLQKNELLRAQREATQCREQAAQYLETIAELKSRTAHLEQNNARLEASLAKLNQQHAAFGSPNEKPGAHGLGLLPRDSLGHAGAAGAGADADTDAVTSPVVKAPPAVIDLTAAPGLGLGATVVELERQIQKLQEDRKAAEKLYERMKTVRAMLYR